jgi:hypothetical protein
VHKESRGLAVVNGTVYATYSYGAAPNRVGTLCSVVPRLDPLLI